MTRSLNLTELVAGDGGVIELDGEQHRVRPIGTAAYHRYLKAKDAAPEEKYGIIFEIACLQVPTLSEAQRDALTPRQAGAIVALSLETAQEVEESVPNGSGPGDSASPA